MLSTLTFGAMAMLVSAPPVMVMEREPSVSLNSTAAISATPFERAMQSRKRGVTSGSYSSFVIASR